MNKKQIIDFVKSEIECSNQVIIATRGNGGAGLALVNDESIISELESMIYMGGLQAPQDIEYYKDYNPRYYNVHRFGEDNGDNGYYLLIATYMSDVDIEVEDVYNSVITEDEDLYFIDFGAGIGIYQKENWTLEDAIEDQKKCLV